MGKERRVDGGKTSGRLEPSNATPEAKGKGLSENCCRVLGRALGILSLPVSPLCQHPPQRDNEILILSDQGPPRQDHVT